MRRFIASLAILAFLVVNSHFPVAHAVVGALAGEETSSERVRTGAIENSAERCGNHHKAALNGASDLIDPVSQIDAACKVACAAIVDLSVPLPSTTTQPAALGVILHDKHSRWRSISHKPPIPPPFAS